MILASLSKGGEMIGTLSSDAVICLGIALFSTLMGLIAVTNQNDLKVENAKLKRQLSKKPESKKTSQQIAMDFIEIWDALCINDEKLRAELTIKLLNGEIRGSEK